MQPKGAFVPDCCPIRTVSSKVARIRQNTHIPMNLNVATAEARALSQPDFRLSWIRSFESSIG